MPLTSEEWRARHAAHDQAKREAAFPLAPRVSFPHETKTRFFGMLTELLSRKWTSIGLVRTPNTITLCKSIVEVLNQEKHASHFLFHRYGVPHDAPKGKATPKTHSYTFPRNVGETPIYACTLDAPTNAQSVINCIAAAMTLATPTPDTSGCFIVELGQYSKRFCLDIDAISDDSPALTPEDIENIAMGIARKHGVRVWVSISTSGRGVHMYLDRVARNLKVNYEFNVETQRLLQTYTKDATIGTRVKVDTRIFKGTYPGVNKSVYYKHHPALRSLFARSEKAPFHYHVPCGIAVRGGSRFVTARSAGLSLNAWLRGCSMNAEVQKGLVIR